MRDTGNEVDYGLDLYNTWSLTIEQKEDINEYWRCFEEHVKPQASKALKRYYLRIFKKNGRPLDAFITEARLPKLQVHGDTLVFDTDHEDIRKKCITKSNDLTSKKAQDIARTKEATQAQRRAMDAPVPPKQVNSLSEMQNKSIKNNTPRNRPPRDPPQCQRCGNNQQQRGQRCPASDADCLNCHKGGPLSKVCKTRKANVHKYRRAAQPR